MLNYFKSKREHKIRRTYTFDPKVIEELDNYCDENSINKSNMFNNFARYITQSSLPLKQLIKKIMPLLKLKIFIAGKIMVKGPENIFTKFSFLRSVIFIIKASFF